MEDPASGDRFRGPSVDAGSHVWAECTDYDCLLVLRLNPVQGLSMSESIDQACSLVAALDCSTKSAIKKIPMQFASGRSAPGPWRSHEHTMGLPGLSSSDQRRVSKDNCACKVVLDEQQKILHRGGGGCHSREPQQQLALVHPAGSCDVGE